MKKILGIFRAACYSPGMADKDEAILRAVVGRLERTEYTVSLVREEDFTDNIPMPDMVLHMTRSPRALDILQRWQEAGCSVINPVEGVRSVERAALAELCATRDIPIPKTWIVSTSGFSPEDITYPCWVKRTGSCAQEPNDVCRANNAEEYTHCIANLHARGIRQAVVMEHLEGPCIKFYAVGATDFFHCLPAYDKWKISDKKETTNSSVSSEWEKAASKLHHSIEEAMTALQPKGEMARIQVYGGDAIIEPDGTARLIDLNDWPSFSACREEAADAIARLAMTTTNLKKKTSEEKVS